MSQMYLSTYKFN